MGSVIPPSMKAIIGMTTSPPHLSVSTWSGGQYSRPTLGGMWYLALKLFILSEESTKYLNLPI